jgi:hypothetical protein
MIDDGDLGPFIPVIDSLIVGNPGLNQLTITQGFVEESIGKSFRIKVVAFNREGQTDSDIADIVLGDRPLAPINEPRKV